MSTIDRIVRDNYTYYDPACAPIVIQYIENHPDCKDQDPEFTKRLTKVAHRIHRERPTLTEPHLKRLYTYCQDAIAQITPKNDRELKLRGHLHAYAADFASAHAENGHTLEWTITAYHSRMASARDCEDIDEIYRLFSLGFATDYSKTIALETKDPVWAQIWYKTAQEASLVAERLSTHLSRQYRALGEAATYLYDITQDRKYAYPAYIAYVNSAETANAHTERAALFSRAATIAQTMNSTKDRKLWQPRLYYAHEQAAEAYAHFDLPHAARHFQHAAAIALDLLNKTGHIYWRERFEDYTARGLLITAREPRTIFIRKEMPRPVPPLTLAQEAHDRFIKTNDPKDAEQSYDHTIEHAFTIASSPKNALRNLRRKVEKYYSQIGDITWLEREYLIQHYFSNHENTEHRGHFPAAHLAQRIWSLTKEPSWAHLWYDHAAAENELMPEGPRKASVLAQQARAAHTIHGITGTHGREAISAAEEAIRLSEKTNTHSNLRKSLIQIIRELSVQKVK